MPDVRAMHHVPMVTNDLETTKRFYCAFMGGEAVFQGYLLHGASGQCLIALGEGAMLEFSEIDMPEWTSMFLGEDMPRSGRLLEHVAFYVESEEELVRGRRRSTRPVSRSCLPRIGT